MKAGNPTFRFFFTLRSLVRWKPDPGIYPSSPRPPPHSREGEGGGGALPYHFEARRQRKHLDFLDRWFGSGPRLPSTSEVVTPTLVGSPGHPSPRGFKSNMDWTADEVDGWVVFHVQ